MKRALLVAAIGCATPDGAPPVTPAPAPRPVAAPADALQLVVADAAQPTPIATGPEVWLRGSTHVHAQPSGDSKEPVTDVVRWYEDHGYDFIAITDHNRVSEFDGDTLGRPWVRFPDKGLIVLAGIELTHNPEGCEPGGGEDGKCRIHVNALGVTTRPGGKLEWAERKSKLRVDMYHAAINASRALGGTVVQMNHPNWYWGMTAEVIAETARRGAQLVEIANVQFDKYNLGDVDHPSTESMWDVALSSGVTMWGVASDDAHDYKPGGGKYPPGGGWVMVRARRDPQAILDALAVGHFYSSTGVTLAKAEVEAGELVVEATPDAKYTIAWIENGKVVATVTGASARRAVPQRGYLRAVVTRDDGKKAWVQPVRR